MRILVTGGAGFIGCNLVARLLGKGHAVTIYDNLSRPRTPHNLAWLEGLAATSSGSLRFLQGDVRDAATIAAAVADSGAEAIYHLASQVAVTTSVANPREDFEINALGSFNVLEAARLAPARPAVIYASTNKVYGGMEDVAIVEESTRYRYRDLPGGVPETHPLDFHSPYGCCYSADTDILTRSGWKRFYELGSDDEVLTYSVERDTAEFQRPTAHFAFPYQGKMYVQHNQRLKTCVTPNHRMLVAPECDRYSLREPRLLEAQAIAGKPMAYLLGAHVAEGEDRPAFSLPAVKTGSYTPSRPIPMRDWLRFLGWYLNKGHCSQDGTIGNCTVALMTHDRHEEAMTVMRAIGLAPVSDNHQVTATSPQLYEYLRQFGQGHARFIPPPLKALSSEYLRILLHTLLAADGNASSKHNWRYTTPSPQLADDVQEIAIKCGMAAAVCQDEEGFFPVYITTARTAQCNLGQDCSEWIDYQGMVYCVEVPNSVVMVRQNGYAYFSGNSKGAGDQYVRDYHRIYGLPTVVLRQSTIYGPRQFGVEDQGWAAHFAIAALTGRPIKIYGDGKQVRDMLFIDDLIDLYELVLANIERVAGQIFNAGGGPAHTTSIWCEFQPLISQLAGRPIEPAGFGQWRPGDQQVCVLDTSKLQRELGWQPRVSFADGMARLWAWISQHRALFE